MTGPGKEPHQATFYHRLANCYEPVFARFFQERVQAAIREARIPPGSKVLEIGVGTGLSLAAYPVHADVTACDLSDEMLELARAKVETHKWGHIRLVQMDAQDLAFEDESFDFVMAFHVVTVVPDPERLVREMVRVARPDARIVIVNHFRSHRTWVARCVDALNPLTRHFGWRTDLGLCDVLAGQPLQIEERFKTAPHSLFNVVMLRKSPNLKGQKVPRPKIRRVRV